VSEMDERDARHEAEVEQALTDALERRLPQYPASHALKRRLAAAWAAATPVDAGTPEGGVAPGPARPRLRPGAGLVVRGRQRLLLPALAAVLVVGVIVSLLWNGARSPDATMLVAEAVDDHVRVVALDHRLPIESGDTHQVKPWFTGRLDFAPAVGFGGDADFPLKGGAIEEMAGRKAAVFVFGRHLHTISCFVLRADGVRWPGGRTVDVAGHPAIVRTVRGFHVVLWRHADLAYVLVSDVEMPDLLDLAARIAATHD